MWVYWVKNAFSKRAYTPAPQGGLGSGRKLHSRREKGTPRVCSPGQWEFLGLFKPERPAPAIRPTPHRVLAPALPSCNPLPPILYWLERCYRSPESPHGPPKEQLGLSQPAPSPPRQHTGPQDADWHKLYKKLSGASWPYLLQNQMPGNSGWSAKSPGPPDGGLADMRLCPALLSTPAPACAVHRGSALYARLGKPAPADRWFPATPILHTMLVIHLMVLDASTTPWPTPGQKGKGEGQVQQKAKIYFMVKPPLSPRMHLAFLPSSVTQKIWTTLGSRLPSASQPISVRGNNWKQLRRKQNLHQGSWENSCRDSRFIHRKASPYSSLHLSPPFPHLS